MANLSSTTELPQVLDQRQIWFTNLLLLGFDPVSQEDKTKVRFCREMFCHINKKGMEVILHYLFNKLDSHIVYEEFRDCWPVYDKKQEAQFRKVCSNWLTKIAKEDPESKIPRLSASLLLSPGGERFDQLMLRFTTYVLRVVCLREAKGEEKQVFLSSFISSPASLRTSTNRLLLQRALRCHVIRHSQSVASRLELTSELHEQWRQHVTDQVKDLRWLTKQKRELEAEIKAVSATAHSREEKSSASTPATERARKSKMKTVRELWKSLEEFLSKTVHEREVLDVIAKGNANKYTIDAKDLKFQIPDEILHMYEAQLREGTAENTFEDGKLNLLSLIQLWNCALQVIRDRFKECELPSFQTESKQMSDVLQAHRVNLATSQNLRASLMDYQQSLQGSIEKLEKELQVLRASNSHLRAAGAAGEGEGSSETGPPSLHPVHIPPITLPSLGLELLPPSPQKSHDLSSPDMRHLKKHLSHLSLPNDAVSTPEAIHSISESVQRESRSHKPLHPYSQSPSPLKTARSISETASPAHTTYSSTLSPSLGSSQSHTATLSPSLGSSQSHTATLSPSLGSSQSHTATLSPSLGSSQSHTATLSPSLGSSQSHTATLSPSLGSSQSHSRPRPTHRSGSVQQSRVPRVATSRRGTGRGRGGGKTRRAVVVDDVTSAGSLPSALSPQLMPTHPRLMDAMPAAHDILATQIASAMASSSPHTPEHQICSLTDLLSPLGTGAFVSRDKIARSPTSKATQAEGIVTVTSHEATPSTTHHIPLTTHSLSSTSLPLSSPQPPLHISHSSPPHIPSFSQTPPTLLESSTDSLSPSRPLPLVLDSPAKTATPTHHSPSPSLLTPKTTATPLSSTYPPLLPTPTTTAVSLASPNPPLIPTPKTSVSYLTSPCPQHTLSTPNTPAVFLPSLDPHNLSTPKTPVISLPSPHTHTLHTPKASAVSLPSPHPPHTLSTPRTTAVSLPSPDPHSLSSASLVSDLDTADGLVHTKTSQFSQSVATEAGFTVSPLIDLSSPPSLEVSPSQHLPTPTLSQQRVNQRATEQPSSPLIDLSSPLSLSVSTNSPPAKSDSAMAHASTEEDFMSFTSPPANVLTTNTLQSRQSQPPLLTPFSSRLASHQSPLLTPTAAKYQHTPPMSVLTAATLRADQSQSPLLIQFSSSPAKELSSLLTPTVARHTPGPLLQTTPGPSGLSSRGVDTPVVRPTGEPLTTTPNQPTATPNQPAATPNQPATTPNQPTATTTTASPIFAASYRGQSPAIPPTLCQPTPPKDPNTPAQHARDSNLQTQNATVSPLSTAMLSSPFLLSSKPPSPLLLLSSKPPSPLLLHTELDESLLGVGEGGECCEVVEGGNSSRDGRGEGEKRTVGEGEKCTVDNERDHSLFCITDEALNGIPLGVLIHVPTSEHATRPPSLSLSTHTDTSARDSSAQPHSQQLIDFSSSSSHDAEWRPLDVSGDRLNSPSPLPSPPLSTTSHTPLSHPLKSVEENHSNGGIGLFDENDSFLVPLSPQSDFSSQDDTTH